ncbi:hypothetical protein, partial [Vibrio parahaemolyticus]|uniref:hypothetical protein n=1 Tax=Vibrio parahaemolyticus TaxID=670 RepID=UPI00193F1F95
LNAALTFNQVLHKIIWLIRKIKETKVGEVVEEVLPEEKGRELIRRDAKEVEFFCSIYERVNAANDEIKKKYSNSLLVEFSDLQELHEKTCQTIRSLNPSSVGTKIYVSFNNGESEKFNSFEDFQSYKAASPNPTNNVYLVYNFSILDRESANFETYKLKIRVVSRISMIAEFEKEAPPFMSAPMLASIATPTVIIAIEYADYVKARNFISMIDEWVDGVDDEKSSMTVSKAKAFSHLIPKLGRNLIFILLAYFTILSMGETQFTSSQLAKFIVFYGTAFAVLGALATHLLSKVEQAIDSYMVMSYINLTKGDAKLIKRFKGQNKTSALLSAFGVVGTVGVGVFTNYFYDIIKGFLG